jgi:predicted transcriptional regulator
MGGIGGGWGLWYYLFIPSGDSMAATHPVAVKLDADVHARVRELAKAQHRTPHYLMREAIAQYVDREEKRESLRQEALAAWSAYQTSGQHVTHAEADTWLAQLEAGQDVEPPECQG